jgi:hypothetical protein
MEAGFCERLLEFENESRRRGRRWRSERVFDLYIGSKSFINGKVVVASLAEVTGMLSPFRELFDAYMLEMPMATTPTSQCTQAAPGLPRCRLSGFAE